MATHRNNVISTSIESVNSIFQVHNAALAYLAKPCVYILSTHLLLRQRTAELFNTCFGLWAINQFVSGRLLSLREIY